MGDAVSKNIDENINTLEAVFAGAGDFVKRKFSVGDKNVKAYIAYLDMLTDRQMLDTQIITRLITNLRLDSVDMLGNPSEKILNDGVTTADFSTADSFDDICTAILSGDTALFIDGYDSCVIISSKGWPNRGVPTVENESVVFGPKEAFSELFRINTMLVRRRIKDKSLVLYQTKVGRRSKTDVALMYIDGIARPEVIAEAKDRIGRLDIDSLMDAAALEQFIQDDVYSPFPQAQLTERPDKAASAILEGRIAVIVDGSPFALIVPTTLNVFYQASDDYYGGWHISSFMRLLRFAAGVFALALPGFYIACAVFHPSMLPTLLVFKMAGARQNVPFPAVVEILIMEFAFELLREAGVRLPKPVGSSIGIIGGLIMGQAAVEAGLVSPIVVIIVAVTGIAGFAIPNYALLSGFRLTKYLVILMSAFLGLFGFWLGVIIILIHLCSLKSFGVPYMFPFSSGDANSYGDIKDSIFRKPLFMMKKRPIFAREDQENRMREVNTD